MTTTNSNGQIINTNFGGQMDMRASHQWATRPDDERFTNLIDLHAHCSKSRRNSKSAVLANRDLLAEPVSDDNAGLMVVGPTGNRVAASHWAFGQLAGLAGAPAGYLRTLPAPLAADLLNYGLHHQRDVEECGVLLTREDDGAVTLRAATGPQYGRVWNSDLTQRLVDRFGDGLSGDFRVPGEFGKAVDISKRNTTLFAGDRDMFVFLADEQNRIELPNRRDGRTGSLARGFMIKNSEVGGGTLELAAFLFDFTCSNRSIHGINHMTEIKIRHTKGAPHKLAETLLPTLESFTINNREQLLNTERMIKAAQNKRLDDVDTFLKARRFSGAQASAIKTTAMMEEGRPIETLWDASAAVTAYARGFANQDARTDLERIGGQILDMAA